MTIPNGPGGLGRRGRPAARGDGAGPRRGGGRSPAQDPRRPRGARAVPRLPAPAARGPGHRPGLPGQDPPQGRRPPRAGGLRSPTSGSTTSTGTGRCTSPPRPGGRSTSWWTGCRCATRWISGRRSAPPSQTLDPADLLLSKLQIVELNAKDAHDIFHLLSGLRVGRDSTRPFIDPDRFGAVLGRGLGLVADRDRQPEQAARPARLAAEPGPAVPAVRRADPGQAAARDRRHGTQGAQVED
jgi:hypothetical protein